MKGRTALRIESESTAATLTHSLARLVANALVAGGLFLMYRQSIVARFVQQRGGFGRQVFVNFE